MCAQQKPIKILFRASILSKWWKYMMFGTIFIWKFLDTMNNFISCIKYGLNNYNEHCNLYSIPLNHFQYEMVHCTSSTFMKYTTVYSLLVSMNMFRVSRARNWCKNWKYFVFNPFNINPSVKLSPLSPSSIHTLFLYLFLSGSLAKPFILHLNRNCILRSEIKSLPNGINYWSDLQKGHKTKSNKWGKKLSTEMN